MYITAPTLDDLLYRLYTEFVDEPVSINPTKGKCIEKIGVMLHLQNPLQRLSRSETKGKPFSAIGELLWYLSGSNELKFIEYYLSIYSCYAEDDGSVYGAYGPRLLDKDGIDQFRSVINILKAKEHSRQAVIQLFDAKDIIAGKKEVPCTTTLQFFVRDGKLHMFTSMRSNDMFRGLPHDIFAFTFMQEMVARILGKELGEYHHSVGSMHLYDKHRDKAKLYLSEGLQSTLKPMPAMPEGDPMPSISQLLKAEHDIRTKQYNPNSFNLDNYWKDLINLLFVHSFFKANDTKSIEQIKEDMFDKTYNSYIQTKIDSLNKYA